MNPLSAVQALSPVRKYVYAGILACAAAAVAYHLVRVSSLQADVASAQAAQSKAEGDLSKRIAAEALHVAAAVQAARNEDQARLNRLQKDYDDLQNARRSDNVALADARQRLRQLATRRAAASAGDGHVSASPGPAAGVAAAAAQLPERDQRLIDELLRLGAQANEAARQRDFAVKQYQTNCQRKK